MIGLLAATCLAVFAADDSGSMPVNIQIRDATVRDVLQMIARSSDDIDIYITEDVNGKIPYLDIHDITPQAAVETICLAQNLYWKKKGKLYIVSSNPLPESGQLGGEGAAPTPLSPAAPASPTVVETGAAATAAGPPPEPGSEPGVTMQVASRSGEPAPLEVDTIVCKHVSAADMALLFGGSVYNPGEAGLAAYHARRESSKIGGQRNLWNQGQMNYSDWAQLGGRGLAYGAGTYGGTYGGYGGGALGSRMGRTTGIGRGGGYGLGGYGMGGVGTYGGGLGTYGGLTMEQLLPEGMQPPMAYMPLNALLVMGRQDAIDKFREILSLLDQPAKQVEIHTKFLEVQTTEDTAFGIDWWVANGSMEVFNLGFAPAIGASNVVRWKRGDFQTELRTLLESSRAKVINEPFVTAQNNLSAQIDFSTDIPYFTATITYNQFGQREVDYQDSTVSVSHSLYVTPRINVDDTVTMDLQPWIQDQVGFVEGPNGVQLPIVSSQTVYTQVRVADGETVVLGGMIRKNDTLTGRKTPLLHKIPIIGSLFRSRTSQRRSSELLIFVTPKIVREVPPA